MVLIEPTLPTNVGAVARAMNNMGVTELRLINPCDYLAVESVRTAAHSRSILDRAAVFTSLPDAVRDRQLVLGTTARVRSRNARITNLPDIAALIPANPTRVAMVFGRESSGMSNAETSVCHALIHIPTFGGSQSLNLAQAVIVTLYELSKLSPGRQTGAAASKSPSMATSRELEGLKQHFFQTLERIGFLQAQQETTLWQSFSDLLGRARPTRLDVRLIRGFFHRIEVSLKRAGIKHDDARTGPERD